jgi:site-specific DNA-methyltransferase (adenine-specific)
MSCDRKIGPFDCCSVVQGDCLELMKQLPDGCVDAVITDPPYGINYVHGDIHIRNATKFAGVPVIGDDKPFDPNPLFKFPKILVWGANHYANRLPDCGKWLIWDKRCGIIPPRDQSDCEMGWAIGTDSVTARVFRLVWDGFIKGGGEQGIPRVHPTQKPEELMAWCIEFFPDADTILDPFSGSGTTLVAAKKLGRHFLGFEISPEYCEIARDRLARIDAQPNLFEHKPEQLNMEGM